MVLSATLGHDTPPSPYGLGFRGLGGNTFFGVCVVTFGTWRLVILFNLAQGNVLVSQEKVLSSGNEGSMAVTVHIYLFPQSCLICVHIPISGLPLLFPLFYCCNSMYMPNARVSVCTVRRPAC